MKRLALLSVVPTGFLLITIGLLVAYATGGYATLAGMALAFALLTLLTWLMLPILAEP